VEEQIEIIKTGSVNEFAEQYRKSSTSVLHAAIKKEKCE
jgi:hypothetical protein